MTTAHHSGDPTRPESSHRLFFALWPDDSMQSALAAATRTAVAACNGDPVPSRNFHFTLAFLGNVPTSRAVDLNNAAQRAALPGPIAITLDQINYWRRSEILCATSTNPPASAATLAASLKQALVEAGFTPDLEKEFRPHITLARKARTRIPKTPMSPLICSFSNFVLVASQLSPQGSAYTIISRYPHP